MKIKITIAGFFLLFLIKAKAQIEFKAEFSPLLGHWIHHKGSLTDDRTNDLGYSMSHYSPGIKSSFSSIYNVNIKDKALAIYLQAYTILWFENELRDKEDAIFNRKKIRISNGVVAIYGLDIGLSYPLIDQKKYQLLPYFQYGIFETYTTYKEKNHFEIGKAYEIGLENCFFIKKKKVSLSLAMWTGKLDVNEGAYHEFHQINLSKIGCTYYF